MSKDGADARAVAALSLVEVLHQRRSLTAVLPAQLTNLADSRDRALAQELVFGALRWLPRLDACLRPLLRQAIEQTDPTVLAVLRIGLYQLIEGQFPDHAALASTVQACRILGKPWATGLVNAVLRGFLRRREELDTRIQQDPVATYAHPDWLLASLQAAWPDAWTAIAEANNRRAPMSLRVNRLRASRPAYVERLTAADIAAAPIAATDYGVQLARPVAIAELPGFDQGEVSVQDAAAQLAAPLLDLKPGLRVLDACAAPGGKCAHLLELEPKISSLIAVDKDPDRLLRVRENLDRLGLKAEMRAGDAADPAGWWDGLAFDRILIDAPCSGTGVIRRHLDIKWLRQPGDIPAQAAAQQRILEALWPLLAPEGLLLYVTCSVLPAENQDNIDRFLQVHADAQTSPLALKTPLAGQHTCQILPGDQDMDGFFYARLRKQGL